MSGFLLGKRAPTFEAGAVVEGKVEESFSLDRFLGDYVVFFFYPLDFTFVCPTELLAFQDQYEDFRSRRAHVVGCSIDSAFAHLAWLSIPRDKGGIAGVSYPIVADLNKKIARDYGVLDEERGIAFRGLFLIDKVGMVRHQLVNDLPLGRSVDEVIRLLDALMFHEKHGDVCPANWKKGDKAMQPTQEGLLTYYRQQS